MLFFFGYPVELYRKRYLIRIDKAALFDQFHVYNAELPVKNSIYKYNQQEKNQLLFSNLLQKCDYFNRIILKLKPF